MGNDEYISRDEHVVRCEKAEKMRAHQANLWKEALPVTRSLIQAVDSDSEVYEEVHAYSGRLFAKREHGKSFFFELRDSSAKIQLYVSAQTIGDDIFTQIRDFADVGDYVWVEGPLFRTRTNELSIRCERFEITSKCLHALPEKFHGLSDVETRYRQRYLDLMVNEEARKKFIKRSLIISTLRACLELRGFLEVETPMLHPIPGGASARPFVTHHNALSLDFYLRIAPELYLKRLVVGGFERVYELNRNFRNEGVSTRHNPEFTMLEFYMAHADYEFAMTLVEELIRACVEKACGTLLVAYGDRTVDFTKPFKRMTARDALLHSGQVEAQDLTQDHIDATLLKYGCDHALSLSYWSKVFALFECLAEKLLFTPTFIIDFPIELSPLAKPKSTDPECAARFELYIAGMEISNGYNELNDPFLQEERFKEQVEARAAGNEEAMYFDKDFIRCLQYGLPPTAGVGIGIDRLVMLLTNTHTIKDVILFPAMKPKDEE